LQESGVQESGVQESGVQESGVSSRGRLQDTSRRIKLFAARDGKKRSSRIFIL
jgi:hypothetical protein